VRKFSFLCIAGLVGLLLSSASFGDTPVDPLVQPADAVVLPSGVAYKILKPGTGNEHPALTDTITVNYSLWDATEKPLESTVKADGSSEPATFPLGKLIPGWREAIPLMVTGEKIRLWLPAEMAYGVHPTRPGKPAGALIFEIELIAIQH
jgi:peptidylprolyl isomerase